MAIPLLTRLPMLKTDVVEGMGSVMRWTICPNLWLDALMRSFTCAFSSLKAAKASICPAMDSALFTVFLFFVYK